MRSPYEPGYDIARAITFLLEDGVRYGRGECSPGKWKRITQDPDLKSFFEACRTIGDEAWETELHRIRQEEFRRAKLAKRKADGVSEYVIIDLFPRWRIWGRLYRNHMEA